MLEDVRIVIAVLYALLMSADSFMALSGRYERANIRLNVFPYYKDKRTTQACIWGVGHVCIAYASMHEYFYLFGLLYIAMCSAGALAVKRLCSVLRPKPAQPD
jgi:hypothetical protein